MEGGRGRRGNAENQDRSQNQRVISGQNRNLRQPQNVAGNPNPPRGYMAQNPAPAPQRSNPWQNPGNPVALRPNQRQNPGNPVAPRPNPWQNPGNPVATRGNPVAPRPNPWQNPGNPVAPRPNPWQNPGNPVAPRPNPWQNPGNPVAPRPNPWQNPGNPVAPRPNPWQNPGNPVVPRGNPWQNSGNPQNPWQNPGNPVAPRPNPWQNPGNPVAPRGNPWQNPGNPVASRPNPWQNPGNPVAPRGNPWQNPGNPVAPRGNPWQNPGNPAAPRANPWKGPRPVDGGRGSGGGQGQGGHGGGRGRGRALVTDPTPSPSPSPSPSGPLVRELRQLQISLEEPCRVPMKRPDDGGKESERQVELLVNYFKTDFNPTTTILHYHIDIKLEKLSKSDALLLTDKLFSQHFSGFPFSYDGKNNMYSPVELPCGKFTVTISKGEDMRQGEYVISIILVNKLELRVLDEYLNGGGHSIPRDVLQAMDIVMQENPRRTQLIVGRGFFYRSPSYTRDVGEGIIAGKGYRQSLKLTSEGVFLCIDSTVMPFRKAVSVIQFLEQHLNIRFSKWMQPDQNLLRKVEKALKGLKVRVTHRNSSQKFVVLGLTRLDANCIRFDLEDRDNTKPKREVTLVEYYFENYNQDIEYKCLPCLDLSKGRRKNYVPMEFCVLIEGQTYPKDALSKNADRQLKEFSLIGPMERKGRILDAVVADDGPCGGEIARQFDITVRKEMTRLMGRVLSPPTLKLRSANNKYSAFKPQGTCQYNLNDHKVLDGKDIIRWGILDFSQHWTTLDFDRFSQALIERSRKLGIHMKNRLFYEKSSMDVLSKPEALSELLKRVYHGVAEGKLQILFCPMAEKHEGYKTLKRICEMEIGIVTQCCLSNILAKKFNDQCFANICLKVNAKLGGNNMELYHPLPNLEGDDHVMFFGADVNHPTGQDRLSPSITAVVATMNWPAANHYAQRFRVQTHAEKIQHIGEMCSELLEVYAKVNGVKPKRIIFFRDGVSESQFDMVLNEELPEIIKAIDSDEYKPTITILVAQKRHLTRLFPVNERDGGKSGNIAPGTVVDNTITHPKEFYDFYLNSHNGIRGTSKPTHYYVLWDDHGFSSDQLQRLIYNLCYTLPHSTNPISLVTPVCYADLAAYRGRLYWDSLNDHRSPAASLSSPAFDHSKFPKVHSDLENRMICI